MATTVIAFIVFGADAVAALWKISGDNALE